MYKWGLATDDYKGILKSPSMDFLREVNSICLERVFAADGARRYGIASMSTRFRHFLWVLAFCAAGAAADGLPPAADLAADADEAAAGAMPILVFFTSPSCPYCHEVEGLYLQPMQERGTYRGRLLIRAVEVGGAAPLMDFAGRRTDHGEFARREMVSFTPVIRLYGPDGGELVPQLFGYTTPDFYWGYLEQAIEQAIAQRKRDSHKIVQRRDAEAQRSFD